VFRRLEKEYESGTDSGNELRVNTGQDSNKWHTQPRINQKGCAHGIRFGIQIKVCGFSKKVRKSELHL